MQGNSKLHIGISGWSYPDFKGILYPEKCKSGDFLSNYCKEFNCTELNSSFYRIPQRKFIERWMECTPEHFKFCAKLYRGITHFKKLKPEPQLMLDYWERWEGFAHRL